MRTCRGTLGCPRPICHATGCRGGCGAWRDGRTLLMPFELHDFQDLIRFLRDHPDWREELRALLLTQELLTLPALVRELTETVAHLADRLDQLAQTVTHLTEGQQRLTDRLDQLTQTVTHLTEGQQRLTEEQIGRAHV